MGFLKHSIKSLWAMPSVWNVLGRCVREPGLNVLMYHRVEARPSIFPALDLHAFEEQMRWLKAHCQVLSPGELLEALHMQKRLDKWQVLVTFDDGYRAFYSDVYPILRKHRVPAIMFLATQFVDEGGMIWTDQVLWAIYHTHKKELRLPWQRDRVLPLDTTPNKAAAIQYAKAYLKKLPDEQRRRYLADMIGDLDAQQSLLEADRQMLSWDEVRDSMDLVTYGGHTHTHPIMSRLDKGDLDWEIRTCRDRIEQETGVRPTYFAYPNGTEADFNDACKTALKHCGFDVAFSTIEGINPEGTDTMALRRRHGDITTVPDFVWQVSRPIH